MGPGVRNHRVKRRTRRILSALALGVATLTLTLSAAPALAYAELEIGPYTVAIGFGTEPLYVGFPNSLEVIIHETASGKAVESAADTLKAEVSFGSASKPVTLEPNFDEDSGGSPGDYRSAFIPTSPGAYRFHITGTIGSTNVDEKVTSSPTTFDSAVDPQTIQFPAKVPSSTELATRLERETARINTGVAAQIKSAKDAASSTKSLAYIGIAAGALGLIGAP